MILRKRLPRISKNYFDMTTVKTQSWKRMRFADFVDTAPKSILEKSREYPFIPMELIDGVSKYPTS